MSYKKIKTIDIWIKFVNIAPKLVKDWFKKENLAIKKNINKADIVLDIGCGYGRNILAIAGKAKIVVGLDFDKIAIKEAKKFLSKFKNVRFVNKDILKYKEIKNKFDVIMIVGHTFGNFGNEKQAVLKIVSKLLKPQGRLILSVYSKESLPYRLPYYTKYSGKPDRINDNGVYYKSGMVSEHFSRQRLSDILKDAGYKSKITRLNKISYFAVAQKID